MYGYNKKCIDHWLIRDMANEARAPRRFVYWTFKIRFLYFSVFLKLINGPYGYEDFLFNMYAKI
jgi:hypothetical protein